MTTLIADLILPLWLAPVAANARGRQRHPPSLTVPGIVRRQGGGSGRGGFPASDSMVWWWFRGVALGAGLLAAQVGVCS